MISIITVVFNAKEQIEKTIKSIINQTYNNIEFIIIDGGSTDGTIDIIKEYNSKIDYWISEVDNGVFDGMNKGIKAATGDWINFMNAGDFFVDENVLAKIDFKGCSKMGLIYGNTKYDSVIRRPFDLTSLQYGTIMACHQSMFFNKSLIGKQLYYSQKFKLICDYDLVCRIVKAKYQLKYIDLTIAHYLGGGLSSVIDWEARKARYYFVVKHFKLKGFVKTFLESFGILSLPERLK